jgi:hypothetical protein
MASSPSVEFAHRQHPSHHHHQQQQQYNPEYSREEVFYEQSITTPAGRGDSDSDSLHSISMLNMTGATLAERREMDYEHQHQYQQTPGYADRPPRPSTTPSKHQPRHDNSDDRYEAVAMCVPVLCIIV